MFRIGDSAYNRVVNHAIHCVLMVVPWVPNAAVNAAIQMPVADPAVWYSADAGVSLSNGVVTQWDDLSGNGYHLTLSQGDPAYLSNATNGMPAVLFDGDDVLESNYAGETATLFVVGKTTAPDGSVQTYVSGGTTSGPGAWSFYADAPGTAGQAFTQHTLSGATVLTAQGSEADLITDTTYLQAGRLDKPAGTIELYSQGFLKGSGSVSDTYASASQLALGASYSPGLLYDGYLNGEINEVLIYDRVLNNTEVQKVQSYLTRWFGGYPTENNFLAASWVGDTDQHLYILQSEDAHTFTGAYASHDPIGDDVVRDPSIMYDQDTGYWWVTYTAGHWSVQTDYIGLARSKDGVFWDNVARIDTSSIAQGNPRSWAPEWVEDEDGWHVVVGLSSNGSGILEMYELHPTTKDFMSWSLPEKLTGLQNDVVDGMITLIGGVYHIWYTDRTVTPWLNVHATADSLTGPYTLDPDLQGNWYPVEASVEGPYVVQIAGDHWRMYFDQPGQGTKLIAGQSTGLYIDSYDGMQTWGPPNQMDSPAKRHLSIVNMSLIDLILTGDLNADGFVGLEDLDIVLSNWNQPVNPGDLLAGDPSNDGYVGLDDLDVVLSNWNSGTPQGAGLSDIPEPSSAGLILLGVIGFMLRHRN